MTTPPTLAATRHAAAYAQRMNRVLDHIDAHLDVELDLATLAAVAHFSPFHFHRVFSAWMGETLGDYLRRRRLDRAALLLAGNPRRSVLEVALAVGFGSGEAFARAFRQRFACTPTAWREDTPRRWRGELVEQRRRHVQRKADQAGSKDEQAARGGPTDDGALATTESPMDVTIKTLPAARVAYLRHIGPYGRPVSEFWKRVAVPWLQANGYADGPLYGIGRDDPCVTAPDKCRYDVCCPIPEGVVPAAPAGVDTLPGGRYAVAPFFGDSTDLAHAYTELLRDWLPASGFGVDDRPIYEYYRPNPRYEPETGRFECTLCIPLRPA
jgi:AraC family transcriptional regulator